MNANVRRKQNPNRRKKDYTLWIIGFAVFFSFLLSALPNFVARNVTVDAEVSKTERICTGSSESMECKYIIFTSKGVFENTDSVYNLKFNSSDIYGDLKLGQSYTFKTVGWRVPFLSMYPNIISYKAE